MKIRRSAGLLPAYTRETDDQIRAAIQAGTWVDQEGDIRPGDILRSVEITKVLPKNGLWLLFKIFPVDIVDEHVQRLERAK